VAWARWAATAWGALPRTVGLGTLPRADHRGWLGEGAAAEAQARVAVAAMALRDTPGRLLLTGSSARGWNEPGGPDRSPPPALCLLWPARPPGDIRGPAPPRPPRPQRVRDVPAGDAATVRAHVHGEDWLRAWVAWRRWAAAHPGPADAWAWLADAWALLTGHHAPLARTIEGPVSVGRLAMRAWALDRAGHSRRAHHLLQRVRRDAHADADRCALALALAVRHVEDAAGATRGATARDDNLRRGDLLGAARHAETVSGPTPAVRWYHDHVTLDAILDAAGRLQRGDDDGADLALEGLSPESIDAPSVEHHGVLLRWAQATLAGDHALVASLLPRVRGVLTRPEGSDARPLPDAPYRFLLSVATRAQAEHPVLARRLRQVLFDHVGPRRRAELRPLLLARDGPLILGDYLMDRPIGEGGTGTVWSGRHAGLLAPVAIKVVHQRAHADAAEAFRLEVDLVSRLEHRHVVGVLDLGTVGDGAAEASGGRLSAGLPYLVMERVDGGTLHGRIGTLDTRRILSVVDQILQALAYAHGRGVVHRDVKPANVLLTPAGAVRLADFGLAALAGLRGGTPHYMAPEQFRHGRADPRSDLYSVGVLAWELCCGRPPYRGDGLAEQHARGQLPPFRPSVAVPEGLDRMLRWCLDPDPDGRPTSAWALLQAWRRLSDPDAASADPAPPGPTPAAAPTTFLLDDDLDPPVDPDRAPVPAVPAGHTLQLPPRRTVFRLRAPTTRLLLRGDAEVVGQRDARQQLLESLQQVLDHRRRVTVVLDGPRGTGRGSLIRWLGHTAREQGFFLADPPGPDDVGIVVDPSGPVPAHHPWLVIRAAAPARDVDRRVQVKPLGPLALYFVARQRAPIAPPLAAAAVQRAVGRPALMMRLVEGWRKRPGLRAGPAGLELLGPARRTPEAMSWWHHHLAQLAPADRRVLALLSVLPGRSPRSHLTDLLGRLGEAGPIPPHYHYVEDDRWTMPPELRAALGDELDLRPAHAAAAARPLADHEVPLTARIHRLRAGRPVEAEALEDGVRDVLLRRSNARPWKLGEDTIDELRAWIDAGSHGWPRVHAWLELALATRELSLQPRRAVAHLRSIAELAERDGHAPLAAAACLAIPTSLAPPELILRLQRLSERLDRPAEVAWLRGELAVRRHDRDAVHRLLATANAEDDRMLGLRLRLYLSARTEDLAHATHHVEHAVAHTPHPRFASALLGNLCHRLLAHGDVEAAERVGRRAVAHFPSQYAAWINLALALLALDQVPLAAWTAMEGSRRAFTEGMGHAGQHGLLVMTAGSLSWPTERWEDFAATLCSPHRLGGGAPVDPLVVDVVRAFLHRQPDSPRVRQIRAAVDDFADGVAR